jgi:hypothetical protein
MDDDLGPCTAGASEGPRSTDASVGAARSKSASGWAHAIQQAMHVVAGVRRDSAERSVLHLEPLRVFGITPGS